jgi:hypothetical protein
MKKYLTNFLSGHTISTKKKIVTLPKTQNPCPPQCVHFNPTPILWNSENLQKLSCLLFDLKFVCDLFLPIFYPYKGILCERFTLNEKGF